VRSLKRVTELIRKNYEDIALVVSVMTEGGYDTALQEIKPDIALMLPVENCIAIRRSLRKYKVKLFFITDSEFWPILIHSIPKKIPLFLLNARISDKTFSNYYTFRLLFAPLLKKFKAIFAKSGEDADKFARIIGGEPDNLFVGGNVKFFLDEEEPVTPKIKGITGRVAFAASTHAPEEDTFLRCAEKLRKDFDRFVIAPRHIRRAAEVKELSKKHGFKTALYSDKNRKGAEVIVVDELGLLEGIYKVSSRIFVGGSMADIGGHNIFEALKHRKSVAVGKYTYNFKDIVPLALEYGVAEVVNNESELLSYLAPPHLKCSFEPFLRHIAQKQNAYFDTVMKYIQDALDDHSSGVYQKNKPEKL
jgi:3-deoxy-D-manno-octulosonic-acid transferase